MDLEKKILERQVRTQVILHALSKKSDKHLILDLYILKERVHLEK